MSTCYSRPRSSVRGQRVITTTPSISDQAQYHPNQFEFKTLAEVPESHAWTNVHDHPFADPAGPGGAVPIIHLEDPDVVPLIGAACREWGAFQVTGHGVPAGLFDRLESRVHQLFSLPTSQKLRAARGPNKVGGYGVQTITSFFSKLFWSEGYTIIGSPDDDARRLWPEDHAEFCALIEEYTTAMKELGGRLVHLMLLSLGLTEEEPEQEGPLKDFGEATPVLQLNSYPACPDPDRAIGLAAHQDTSLITILHQNATSGLQVLHGEDLNGPARWVTVTPVLGALVVNVGDLSHILSNGRFNSVLHRAVVNRKQHRLSAAYFCGTAAHVKISPIEKLLVPGERPIYRAVTWPEYLGIKKRLFNKSLAAIKLPAEEKRGEDHHAVSSISSELHSNGPVEIKG